MRSPRLPTCALASHVHLAEKILLEVGLINEQCASAVQHKRGEIEIILGPAKVGRRKQSIRCTPHSLFSAPPLFARSNGCSRRCPQRPGRGAHPALRVRPGEKYRCYARVCRLDCRVYYCRRDARGRGLATVSPRYLPGSPMWAPCEPPFAPQDHEEQLMTAWLP